MLPTATPTTIALHTKYNLIDVLTETSHKLHKGGIVRPIHVFAAGSIPDPDRIAEYTGFDRASAAYKCAILPYKDARIVLERITPAGKTFLLTGKHVGFLTQMGVLPELDDRGHTTQTFTIAATKEPKKVKAKEVLRSAISEPYTDPAKILEDISVGQVWQMRINGGDERVRIVSIGRDEAGERINVSVEYNMNVRGSHQWVSSNSLLALGDFVASAGAKGARLLG